MRTLSVAFLAPSILLAACTDDQSQYEHENELKTAELFASDPIRHTYDFVRADYGVVLQDNMLYNVGTHIMTGYYPGDFTVGVQGTDRGAIIDLGTEEDVATRLGIGLGYPGQVFAQLTLDDPGVRQLHDLALEPIAHTKIEARHIYGVRVDLGTSELIVKLFTTWTDDTASRVSLDWVRLR